MEKKNTNMEDSQEPTEKMECDEKPTGSESIPELTENTNSSKKVTGTEEKPKPSTMTSKTTSGIELESKPSTSALHSLRKKGKLASTPKPSTMTSKTTSGIELDSKPSTSAVESPRKKGKLASNPKPSTMTSKTTSGIELETKPSTSVQHSPRKKNKLASNPTGKSSPAETLKNFVKRSPQKKIKYKTLTDTAPEESYSESLSPSDESLISQDIVNAEEACSSKGEEDEKNPASNPTSKFSPSKTLKNLVKYMSPKNKYKTFTDTEPEENHSKSSPPSDKSLISKKIVNPEEACTSKGEEDNFMKRVKNIGIKSIENRLHNIMPRIKSTTSSETATLVCEEETGQTENAPINATMPEIEPKEAKDFRKFMVEIQYSDPIRSPIDPSYDGATMTDTSSSSTVDFSGEMSIKPSETGENTLAEAVADSPPGSSEEDPEVQDDKYLDSSKK